MHIREATLADVPAMTAILNWAITQTDALFRANEATVAEREEFHRQLEADGYPCLVAEENGQLLGWALYKPYRDPQLWYRACEDTIYIDPAAHGRGVGTALMAELVARACADPKAHSLIAQITGANSASVALHRKHGFSQVGTLRQVARKFDRFLDLHILQRLTPHP
ncbi:N-acetyltransferase [Corynebacterium lizhenjunii]|uniref:N-acetyltransferase n=1 Tax=Corynebacterium lizhenjunii TaxID=2709394 RepID=A0A7T0PB57_9CORY|nr:GNAT family N-acetyltransferase [Corynebacterium lizhenjunii]QPK79816.1 N-acetyltransferase [Corynebacterium lizhenjunii]